MTVVVLVVVIVIVNNYNKCNELDTHNWENKRYGNTIMKKKKNKKLWWCSVVVVVVLVVVVIVNSSTSSQSIWLFDGVKRWRSQRIRIRDDDEEV